MAITSAESGVLRQSVRTPDGIFKYFRIFKKKILRFEVIWDDFECGVKDKIKVKIFNYF